MFLLLWIACTSEPSEPPEPEELYAEFRDTLLKCSETCRITHGIANEQYRDCTKQCVVNNPYPKEKNQTAYCEQRVKHLIKTYALQDEKDLQAAREKVRERITDAGVEKYVEPDYLTTKVCLKYFADVKKCRAESPEKTTKLLYGCNATLLGYYHGGLGE